MNPIIMSMLVEAKQVEINRAAEKRRLFNENSRSGDRSDTLQNLAFSLAAMGVIVFLVVWAITTV
jgi:hypothetical protein